jgi:hypothetical protein
MMSIIGRVFSAMATRPSCLHLILLWIFSSTILCGCADHRVDVSHGPHGFKESAPLCFRPEIPFRYDVFVAHRRVWSGMRGGYMSSKAMGKSYLGHKHYFHSGGAHDVAMFLWLQMCMSGFPPHPGPDSEIKGASTPASTGNNALRYDIQHRVLSLFDVCGQFRGSSDGELTSLYIKRLRTKPQWFLQCLQRVHNFQNYRGKPTPVLASMQELMKFVELHRSACKPGKKSDQLERRVAAFFQTHSEILKEIWPDGDVLKPNKVVSIHYTTNDAMDKLASHSGFDIVKTTTPGVFHTIVPVTRLQELVDLVGVFTCTHFSSHSYTKRSRDGETTTAYIRFDCFRGLRCKSRAKKQSSPNKPVVARPFCKTVKCSCTADITAKFVKAAGTAIATPIMMEVTLNLCHTHHTPGTVADALLLPLMHDVQTKLDMITKVTRNKIVIRKMVSKWLKEEYLPANYPSISYNTLHPLDGRFFPSMFSISNSIKQSAKVFQHSDVDQESTFSYIASRPGLSWVLRPAQGDCTTYCHIPGDLSEPVTATNTTSTIYIATDHLEPILSWQFHLNTCASTCAYLRMPMQPSNNL